MYITVCDVPKECEESLVAIGGEIMRSWNGLSDVQFKSDECTMVVRENYIKIRNRMIHKSELLSENEFTNVIIN